MHHRFGKISIETVDQILPVLCQFNMRPTVGKPTMWGSTITALAQLVDCRTLDHKVAGSNLTRGVVLCP